MINETWKPIEKITRFNPNLTIKDSIDFTECKYQVSNLGRVRNSNNKILKGWVSRGYRYFELRLNKKGVQVACHQVTLQTFSDTAIEGCSVDHKDQNKSNNHIDNLRWLNPKEQTANRGIEYIRYLEKLLTDNNIFYEKKGIC